MYFSTSSANPEMKFSAPLIMELFVLIDVHSSDHNGREVWGIKYLHPLKH
jgi:hypothetical protein